MKEESGENPARWSKDYDALAGAAVSLGRTSDFVCKTVNNLARKSKNLVKSFENLTKSADDSGK
jgi:hypothetical protein